MIKGIKDDFGYKKRLDIRIRRIEFSRISKIVQTGCSCPQTLQESGTMGTAQAQLSSTPRLYFPPLYADVTIRNQPFSPHGSPHELRPIQYSIPFSSTPHPAKLKMWFSCAYRWNSVYTP